MSTSHAPSSQRPICLMISGSGRSGTTILSVLLSQDPAVMNIGQLRDIWAAWADDAPCTCGTTVRQCPFWGEVRGVAFGGRDGDLQAHAAAMRAFMTDAEALRDWNEATALAMLAERHDGFLQVLRAVIDAAVEVSGAKVLVDSSKSPEFALAVHLTGAVQVHVLNLVRDPRAVACSWARKRPGKIGQRIDAWARRQKRLSAWRDAEHLSHRALRYEDFVAAPKANLGSLLGWIGQSLPDGLWQADGTAQVSWDRQHLFPPSNETVLAERRTRVTIAAPTEWRAIRWWPLHLRVFIRSFPSGLAYVLGTGRT